jgi:hypothetical protein
MLYYSMKNKIILTDADGVYLIEAI